MRISDWSSDVCSSDLGEYRRRQQPRYGCDKGSRMLSFKPNRTNGINPMELNELPPKDGAQRAYCCACGGPLDLLFVRFHDLVSGVEIDMNEVPQLECSACGLRTLPDRTRFFIMHAPEIGRASCREGVCPYG